jgi:acyl dehydratase
MFAVERLLSAPLPPTEPYEVSSAALARFAAAIGHTGPNPPPTFLIVLCTHALNAVRRVLPATTVLVHRGQSFRHFRPVRVGDRLIATPTVVELKRQPTTLTFSVRIEIATVTGEPVCVATSMLALIPTPNFKVP